MKGVEARDVAFQEQMEEVSALPENAVILAIIKPLHYQRAATQLIHHLVDRFFPGIYVTLNKPHLTVRGILEEEGIDTSRIFFIDAITDKQGENESCIYLGNGQDLTSICLTISKSIRLLGESKFIFFDSLSTLLIYNEALNVARFSHILTSRIRKRNMFGAILSVELQAERDVLSQLAQFVDKTVRW